MNVPPTRYARSRDGAFIAYQVFGEGAVDLLWISPWFSHLEVVWEYRPIVEFYEALSSFARVIVLDQRGIGLSDKTKGLPDLETRMDDVRAVLDAADSERTVLWGAGPDGGSLVAMYAATYPDRVLALAFWNASARTSWAPDYPWGAKPEVFARFEQLLVEAWGSVDRTPEIARAVGIPSVAERPEAVRWMAKANRHMGSPGDVVAFDRMWNAIDFRGILTSIHVPTLCLYPDEGRSEGADPVTDVGEFEHFAAMVPGARSVTLPPGDFPPWAGHTLRATAAVREFVAGVTAAEVDMERVLATVVFTDIVDSTATAARMGDAPWRRLIDEHDRIGRGIVARYRGEYVDSTGDGLLATFDGPARAVRCAQALVDAVKVLGVTLRAGAHTGEIAHSESNIAGLGVHVAARVASLAGTNEVWASSTVKDLTAGSGLVFEDAGEHELKGVPDRWRLYRVIPPG